MYPASEIPMLCYSKRVPIVTRPDEELEVAAERALAVVALALVREGAPTAARAAGTLHIGDTVVSIDAPWEKTSVRMEHLQEDKPFTLTKKGVEELLKSSRPEISKENQDICEEHIIDTRLNGYQNHDPYGKRATRAAFTILTSSIHTRTVESVTALLRTHFHHASARYISGPSLRYQVLRTLFPHERDVLIIDALRKDGAVLSLTRAGVLVAMSESEGSRDTTAWMDAAKRTLGEFAAQYPLPRTMLLVADETEVGRLKQAFDAISLASAWFSSPPKILPVHRNQLGSIRIPSETLEDIRLSIMAQY